MASGGFLNTLKKSTANSLVRSLYTPSLGMTVKSLETKKKKEPEYSTLPKDTSETLSDLLAADSKISGSSSSGGYGGYTPQKADISGVLAAFEQQAATNRDTVNQTYENTRSDLLNSLKRYQEENARNVENQKKAYLSNQASLESARAEADRQNRINAAARGLGGSGLQQLSQLQNLISQGQDISNLATENQSELDKLREALAQKQEDTDTALSRAEQTRDLSLRNIADTLAANKEQAELKAETDFINALNSARAAAASAASSSRSNQANAETAMRGFIEELYKAQTQQQQGNTGAIEDKKKTWVPNADDYSKVTNKAVLNAYAQNLAEMYGADLSSYLKKYDKWFTG